MRPRVALATCRALPEGDADDRALPGTLAAHGIDATWEIWDDPAADWAAFDLVLVRSPWDYQDRRNAFVAWARAVPRIANPADVLAWNTDKRYLADLGGEFSHGFRKAPILTGEGVVALADPVGGLPAAEAMFAPETITPRPPDRAQRATADWVLLYLRERFGPLAYARIDLVPGPDGVPLLLEAELTEPSLYLWLAAGAADRLARAVAAAL
jgi:hypothetical protein